MKTIETEVKIKTVKTVKKSVCLLFTPTKYILKKFIFYFLTLFVTINFTCIVFTTMGSTDKKQYLR